MEELNSRALTSEDEFERLSPVSEMLSDEKDPWVAFESIKTAIPVAYRNCIRSELGKSQDAPIPRAHKAIWNLPISGVISLNIDSFARRAASESNPGIELKIEVGAAAGRIQRVMHTNHKFLYELHGSFDDADSWVFTASELKRLYESAGYKSFLTALFTTYTVVFVGISADDIAIGGPLKDLGKRGIQGPEHYWITDREDSDALNWADEAFVELVKYPNGDHGMVLDILEDLSKAVASEPEAAPVSSTVSGTSSLIEAPGELMKLDTVDIRLKLNQYANHLLGQGLRQDFDKFIDEYDELVDRAWYIPRDITDYQLFDYRLLEKPTNGAFGSVYQVMDSKGRVLALKLLKRDIRGNLPLLHSFRRGVQAMKIVEEREIPGMVAHQDASEIPAFVTMEWIDGPNVRDAKGAGLLDDWSSILEVVEEVARIVFRAHGLPEKLLHRDLRPANVMLRNGWTEQTKWDVVVLDFDLATYTGATTDSVLAEGSALGYLAPEQLVSATGKTAKVSSRSTLVDSFGLGMTLYFMVSGEEPEAYMQRDSEYLTRLTDACSKPVGVEFSCLPARISRLITNATRDKQGDRWSVSLILREIERLRAANSGSTSHAIDADLVAEEIACHCEMISRKYRWSERDDAAEYRVQGGPFVSVRGSAEDIEVTVKLEWVDDGVNDRKSMRKYLPARMDQAKRSLVEGGWVIDASISRDKTVSIVATYPVSVDTSPELAGESLNGAIEALTFS